MKGKAIIVSAPSGAGKTTIVKELLKAIPTLAFSVSACTRPKRINEVDGKDYYFISPDEFREKIKQDAFIEWEEVYPGNYYGTFKSEINRIWSEGKNVIFDVDVAGGVNLKRYFGLKALAIFIEPPSVGHLETRLINRKTDSAESIETRLNKAKYELTFAKEFDLVIVNDVLETAVTTTIKSITDFCSERN